MGVSFATGFEAQQAATDGVTLTGSAAYVSSVPRTGAYAVECNPGSGASGYVTLPTGIYVHFGLYVWTPADRLIFGAISAGRINVRLTSSGALDVYLNTTLIGTSAATFSAIGWHWVGVRQVTGTSVAFLQIDGVDQVTGTATVSSQSVVIGAPGTEAVAIDLAIDDVIFDNAGFLGPSRVDIALPISDNTRTGVTDANGATTNLWQAVDNTPPAGVASASEAANPKASIKYPASTTSDYIANLETYTTLGINSGDTVLAVQAVIRHGEDIATGTKNFQNFGALTNPTSTGLSNVVAGSDGGAHGAETGLWVTTFPSLIVSPSVTLGTSPTIRVQRASESRVACIDFMGMLVAWTPAPMPRFFPYPPLLAQ